jgi:hypothetical protein
LVNAHRHRPTPIRAVGRATALLPTSMLSSSESSKEFVMGKYLIAWILGVPAFVLVIAYFFFH